MKTFNYKNQIFTCEIIHKNTNPAAKSKCIRIITEDGIRNIYTIASGYSNPVAYKNNKVILSDIVVGKAFSILGLMKPGKKFVFTEDVTSNVSTPIVSSIPTEQCFNANNISASDINSMYRVIDMNTGSVAMFSSEIDVVSYCIGKMVKVDKVDISIGIINTNTTTQVVSESIDIDTTTDIEEEDEKPITRNNVVDSIDTSPKRVKKTDYTIPNLNRNTTVNTDITNSSPVNIPTSYSTDIDDSPKPTRRRKS